MVPWPSLIVVVTSAVFELNDFDPILLESAQPQIAASSFLCLLTQIAN